MISSARFAAVLTTFVLLGTPSLVRAEDKFAQCAADSEEAQSLRDKNRYRAARAKFRSCAQSSCPGVVRKDCTKWLAELEEVMPSIVVGAVDEKGTDLVDVELSMDGETLAARLDGTPIAVDPGAHELRATAPGREPVKMPIVVRVGDKTRQVRITIPSGGTKAVDPEATPASTPAPDAPAAGRVSHGPPLASIVLGSVGVAALASWGIFGLTAQSDFGALKKECGPSCPDGSADGIKTRMLVADVSLGIGVAAVGVAAVLWIVQAPAPAKQASFAGRLQLGAAPVRGGAAAGLGGSF